MTKSALALMCSAWMGTPSFAEIIAHFVEMSSESEYNDFCDYYEVGHGTVSRWRTGGRAPRMMLQNVIVNWIRAWASA